MQRNPSDATSARTERAWWSRLDPMSASWPMVAVDVVWVVVLTGLCGWAATSGRSGWSAAVAYGVIASVVVFAVTALPLRYFLLAQRRVAADRERLLEAEGERRLFEAQVVRALDMAEDRDGALHVAIDALHLALPGARGEILLADSSRAHLRRSRRRTSSTCCTRARSTRRDGARRCGTATRCRSMTAVRSTPVRT